jgi:hypothetical protein
VVTNILTLETNYFDDPEQFYCFSESFLCHPHIIFSSTIVNAFTLRHTSTWCLQHSIYMDLPKWHKFISIRISQCPRIILPEHWKHSNVIMTSVASLEGECGTLRNKISRGLPLTSFVMSYLPSALICFYDHSWCPTDATEHACTYSFWT